MDSNLFYTACQTVNEGYRLKSGIGTLGEKSVHAVLKNYFEPYIDSQEQKIGGFVADIIGENGIMEIQTSDLGKLRRKLGAFLPLSKVTIVHPIYERVRIMRIEELSGDTLTNRYSPKHSTFYDALPELYQIKQFLDDENLTIHLMLMEVEEYRLIETVQAKHRSRRDHVKYDRIPVELNDELILSRPEDYLFFIPEELRDKEFTTTDIVNASGCRVSQAQLAANILSHLKVIEKIGMSGRNHLYKVCG